MKRLWHYGLLPHFHELVAFPPWFQPPYYLHNLRIFIYNGKVILYSQYIHFFIYFKPFCQL